MTSEDRDGRPVAGHGRRLSRSVAVAMAALLSVMGLVACGGGNKNKGEQAGNVSTASGKQLVLPVEQLVRGLAAFGLGWRKSAAHRLPGLRRQLREQPAQCLEVSCGLGEPRQYQPGGTDCAFCRQLQRSLRRRLLHPATQYFRAAGFTRRGVVSAPPKRTAARPQGHLSARVRLQPDRRAAFR